MFLAAVCSTCQVNYTNSFTQVELKEKIYIETPKGFERKEKEI